MKNLFLNIFQSLTKKNSEPEETPVRIDNVMRNTFIEGDFDKIQKYLNKTFEL